jgi:ATP-dependent Clp protease adapter protein ClpS
LARGRWLKFLQKLTSTEDQAHQEKKMDVTGLANTASIADTGTKQDVALEVLKRAQQIESATATQLIEAIQPAPNLPDHLGKNVDTTA